jgi:spermidine synthase
LKYRFEKPVAGFLFFISGAVGLLYQVVWIKSLSYQLGNSAWSISTVVASFMLGLGIGSWYAGKKTDAMRFPFRTYGIIEIGIALFGIISLPLLNHLWVLITPLYDLSSQHPGLFMVIRLLLVFALLFIPTALMGASLPVLVVGLSRVSGFEKTVGLLYGINTLGAAAGVLLTGFLLLPKVGMKITVWIACLLGVLVGSISIVWQKYSQEQDQRSEPAGNTSKSKISWALLLIVFLSGALSLFYEMSWTRLLSPIFGSSTYAFSLILTTFLIGIGLGGLIASQQWINRWPYRRLLSVLIIATSISVLLGLWIVDYLPALFLKMAFYFKNNFSLFFLGQGLLASSLVFLPTLLLGITLPLAIIGFKNEQNSEGEAVGEIYLANTLGAIVGSLLAGFVILPRFGAQQAVVLAAVIGVLAAVLFARTNKSISDQEKNFWAIAGFMVFVLVFVFPPRINMRQLHGGVFRTIRDVNQESKVATQPSLLYLREGHGCTVTVYRSNSDTFLKVNGKTDASMHGDLGTQYLLAHLPMFFSVDPKKICIIGLGSGATLRAVAGHNVKKIDVIELESAVLGAAI